MDSESTQFFQFDKAGNMYVFAPGAGATGPSKLVKLGDELIFNSSYNPADWVTDEWPVTEDKEAIASTCLPQTMSHEFKLPLSEETLYHLVICVQFHLECLGFAFKLMNDPAFKDLKYILDNTMKACTSQGIGISVKQAEILMATDEDLLWLLGCLGPNHPQQLLNTVIFSIGKGFAL